MSLGETIGEPYRRCERSRRSVQRQATSWGRQMTQRRMAALANKMAGSDVYNGVVVVAGAAGFQTRMSAWHEHAS